MCVAECFNFDHLSNWLRSEYVCVCVDKPYKTPVPEEVLLLYERGEPGDMKTPET